MPESNAALVKVLADLGLKAQVIGPVDDVAERIEVTVSRAAVEQRFDVLRGLGLRTSDIARVPRGDLPRLIFTDYVPDATAASFRRAGVCYADEAGNAWISFDSVLIDVRGRRRIDVPARTQVTRGNLFSPGSAQVIFALLAWPTLWRRTRRDVARASGVSLGKAHDVLAILEQGGFGPDGMQRPDGELLDLWAAAFPSGLARRLLLGTFHGPVDAVRSVDETDRLYVSGELAVGDLIKPATLAVYVTELRPRLALVNRWRADGSPNVTVRRSFWQEPSEERVSADGSTVAPWPLVYADLRASTDPRVRAAAGEWKERHAGSLDRP